MLLEAKALIDSAMFAVCISGYYEIAHNFKSNNNVILIGLRPEN
jgi:hypothetical protein